MKPGHGLAGELGPTGGSRGHHIDKTSMRVCYLNAEVLNNSDINLKKYIKQDCCAVFYQSS